MGGLSRICKAYGGIKIETKDKAVEYEWNYKTNKPVVKKIKKKSKPKE